MVPTSNLSLAPVMLAGLVGIFVLLLLLRVPSSDFGFFEFEFEPSPVVTTLGDGLSPLLLLGGASDATRGADMFLTFCIEALIGVLPRSVILASYRAWCL